MNPTQIAAHLSPWELFIQADVIVKSIMVILIIASLASWAIIAEKILRFRSLRQRAEEWLGALAEVHSLTKLSRLIRQAPLDPFFRIYQAIIGEWQETHRLNLHDTDTGKDSLKERINRVAFIANGIEVEKLQRGLSILATVGSVAPFIGLLGTVWGIMNSFQGIAASNNTSLAVVAPGIAEALFATALGLVAAIPAVIGYNKVGGDLNLYASRLNTLSGIVEVQLSRQLESGEPLDVDISETSGVVHGRPAVKLAAQVA